MSADRERVEEAKTVAADPTLSAPPGSRFPAELPAPFGRYRVLKILGKGGMGSVYLAHDSQLDRTVALKVPLLEGGDDAQVLARFYREARAAAALRHPNICAIHDVGQVDGLPYLTMAFIEGKPLAEHVRARPFSERQAALLVRKLALALHEAHTRGIIHRDLKPVNIMIDARGEPVIMDFGLARRLRLGDTRLTQLGSILGTPAYMAPEQIEGDADALGPGCDIYSLGVILYELLAGRLPFTGDIMTILARAVMDEPPPPSEHRPDLDPALESICLKAMAKKVPERHGSMAELAAELADYLRGTISSPRPSGAQPAAPVREWENDTQRISQNLKSGVRSRPAVLAERPDPPAPRSIRLRRRRKKKRGLLASGWVWLGAGVGAVMVALLVGLLLRHVRHGTIKTEVGSAAGRNDDHGVSRDREPVTPEPTDLERIQGEWAVAALIERGVSASPVTLETARVRISGTTMTLTGLGPEQKTTFKLDTTQTPRQFDTQFLSGTGRGQMEPGIYEFADGRLRICFASLEKPVRPTTFISNLENKQELIVLERERAPAPQRPDPSLSPGLMWRINWPGNHLFHTAFSPLGLHFLAGGDTGTLRIWEVSTGRPIGELPIVTGLFTPDGLAVIGHKGKTIVYVYDLLGRPMRPLNLGKTIASLAISPDGKLIACGHPDRTIRLWNFATAEEVRAFEGHTGTADVRFSPSGKYLLSTSGADRCVRLWDVESGKQIRVFDDFKDVTAIPGNDLILQAFFAGEGRLAGYVWGKKKTFLLWDAATGTKIGQLDLGADFHKDLAVSADGRWLLTGHDDRTVRLRDVKTGKELHRFPMADVNVPRGLSFSPDGRYAVAGSHRSWVYLWKLKR